MASSRDFTWMTQYPAISSLDSAKGPSVTVRFPPENLTRAPFELACNPAASSSTPAFINSSLYLPIADINSSLGITPASESLLAFTIIMNRIVRSPLGWARTGLQSGRCRLHLAFTLTSSETPPNRHVPASFLMPWTYASNTFERNDLLTTRASAAYDQRQILAHRMAPGGRGSKTLFRLFQNIDGAIRRWRRSPKESRCR